MALKITKADDLFFAAMNVLDQAQKCGKQSCRVKGFKKTLQDILNEYGKRYVAIPMNANYKTNATKLIKEKVNALKENPIIRKQHECINEKCSGLLKEYLQKAIIYEMDVLRTYKKKKPELKYDITELMESHKKRLALVRLYKKKMTVDNLIDVLYTQFL